MYTNNVKNNKKSSLSAIIIAFVLILAIFLNNQNAYAESDILGFYNDLEKSIDTVISKQEEQPKTEITLYNNTVYIPSMEQMIAQEREAKIQKEIAEQERLEKIEMTIARSTRNVQYNEINTYTDLSIMTTITVDEMNKILDYWGKIRGGNMPFAGKGQMFIDAAKESGLDPVYILAHAAFESGWGTSYYAKEYHNYFGIGAFDGNPDNAINYGNDGMTNGIIKGAKWIADNYYSVGQTSLHTMRYSNSGTHNYCSSTTWADNIASIMSVSYKVIQS